MRRLGRLGQRIPPRVAAAIAAGLFCVYMTENIRRGGVVTPDAYLYASGRAWSSSLLGAAAGRLGGLHAVAALAVASSTIVVYWLARVGGWYSVATLCVLVRTPLGWAFADAGVDALGVLAVVVALSVERGRSNRAGVLALACGSHLAAGLGVLSALAARRLIGVPVWAGLLLAGAGEIFVLRAMGEVLGIRDGYPSEVQWRYLLPGLVGVIARAGYRRIERGMAPVTA